eukprot:3592663-Amphidinium_carterae.1
MGTSGWGVSYVARAGYPRVPWADQVTGHQTQRLPHYLHCSFKVGVRCHQGTSSRFVVYEEQRQLPFKFPAPQKHGHHNGQQFRVEDDMFSSPGLPSIH